MGEEDTVPPRTGLFAALRRRDILAPATTGMDVGDGALGAETHDCPHGRSREESQEGRTAGGARPQEGLERECFMGTEFRRRGRRGDGCPAAEP